MNSLATFRRQAVLASVAVALVVFSTPALAEATEGPDLYHCEPLSVENETTPPPPLWEIEGTGPPVEAEAPGAGVFSCPAGEVAYPEPISETAPPVAAGVRRAASASESRNPFDLSSPILSDAAEVNLPTAPPSASGRPGYYYAGTGRFMVGSVGANIEMSIAAPETDPHRAHSLAEVGLMSGSDHFETVEFGWTVAPSEYGDGAPHLFTYVNRDGYHEPSPYDCYNCHFVPLSGALYAPGQSLAGFVGKSPTQFALMYQNGNWWVWFNFEWIGYLEGSFWGGTLSNPPQHEFWGEVYDVSGGGTDMGNGLYGGNGSAAIMRNPIRYPNTHEFIEEELDGPKVPNGRTVTDPSRYSIGSVSTNHRSWRFGGPGTGIVDPAPAVERVMPLASPTIRRPLPAP